MMNIGKFIFSRLRIPLPLIHSPAFLCYSICLNCNMKLLGHFLIQRSNVAHKPAFLEQLQNNTFQYWIILTMKSEKRAIREGYSDLYFCQSKPWYLLCCWNTLKNICEVSDKYVRRKSRKHIGNIPPLDDTIRSQT